MLFSYKRIQFKTQSDEFILEQNILGLHNVHLA